MIDTLIFKDPLLYRASVFLMDGGSFFGADHSAKLLTNELLPLIQTQSKLHKKPTEFKTTANLSTEFWNVEQDLSETEQLKAFAKSHSDSAVLLLGADKVGTFQTNVIDQWTENQIKKINTTYWNEKNLSKLIRYPHEDGLDATRLRIIGQAWILIAEVENWTMKDWRAFAVERYSQGGWIKFKWGTIGYLTPVDDEPPKFEVLFDPKHKEMLIDFLYKKDFPAFLTAFLKISQFIRYRFQKTQTDLRKYAAQIENWRKNSVFDQPQVFENISIVKIANPASSKSARLGLLEKTVRFGNKILLDYSNSISDLAEYIHTVEVNSAVIEQVVSKNNGKISPFSAGHFWHREVGLFREQMNIEQKYHHIIYDHLRNHFESLKVIADVKKSHFEYLLALVAIVFGAIVGFGQILTSLDDYYWKNAVIIIIIFFIAVSLILAVILSLQRFEIGNESE